MITRNRSEFLIWIHDGLRMGDIRRDAGDWFLVSLRIGRSLVPQPEALQGVRRETSLGSDHFQRRLRLLLQPLAARSIRNHPCFI